MQFIETRGNDGKKPSSVPFSEAILSPSASFGGLYVPEKLPDLGQNFLNKHLSSDYKTLALTFTRMSWIGIHPYYLFQCHKEKGMVHFITPIQIGKIYMKHLQGWISGITLPKYVANIEGGGGKVLLMPSGHDTFNKEFNIDDAISESYAMVKTWDGKELLRYEALGRTKREEYENGVKIMYAFIGRKGVFVPNVSLSRISI